MWNILLECVYTTESEILQIEEAIAIQGNSSFEERAIVLYKVSSIYIYIYIKVMWLVC